MNDIPLLGKLVLELKLFDFWKRDGYLEPFVLFIFVGVEGMSVLFKDIFVVVFLERAFTPLRHHFWWKGISCGKVALRPYL